MFQLCYMFKTIEQMDENPGNKKVYKIVKESFLRKNIIWLKGRKQNNPHHKIGITLQFIIVIG